MDELMKMGRIYRFMNDPMTMVMRAVFATVYCRSDPRQGKSTLKEYLKERRENNKPIYKGWKVVKDFFVSSVAKKVADVEILKQNLDMSFYHTAITQICDNVCKSLPKETKKLFKDVKNLRNNLAHNNFPVSKSIEELLDDCEIICTKLMDSVRKKLGGDHIDQVRSKIQDHIEKVRTENLNFDQYETEQRKFFESMEAKFIRDSQTQLQTGKDFGTSVDPFVKLVRQKSLCRGADYRISDVFVSPVLLIGNERVDYKNILTTLDGEPKSPNALIVCGQGGCGKSTLCHIIFEQWLNKGTKPPTIDGLSSIDLVIYVQMRFTNCETVCDFLRNDYLVDQMKDIKDEEALTLFDSLRVLFVIDGYEENMDHGDIFIKNLTSVFPKSRVVITTRPECRNRCRKVLRLSVTWELIGFGNSERHQFASNIFKLVENDTKIRSNKVKKFKAYLGTRASCLEAHLKLPLTLALLIFLWVENFENLEIMNRINTSSQLYFQLFEMLKEKLIKVRKNLKTGLASGDDVDDVICLLHEKAFEQLKADQLLELTPGSQTAIERRCEDEINPVEVLSAFLVCDSKDSAGLENEKNKLKILYSFFHRSQMEYYSARTVSRDLSTSSTSLRDYFDTPHLPKYRETFVFLAGCLTQDELLTKYCAELLELCKTVVEVNDYNYWFTLLNETEHQVAETCEMYDETMKREMSLFQQNTSMTLDVNTLVSGLNLLAHCPGVQIAELKMSFPSNDDLKNMSGVVPALRRLKHARSRACQARPTDLYLDFGGHSHDAINYLSDPLEYFGDWCRVIEFTGRIKKESVERLLHCTHVTVRVKELEAFNKIAQQSPLMKNLTTLRITVSFPKDEVGTADPSKIQHETAKIEINFPKLIDNDVLKTIKFIKDIRLRPQRFSLVTITGSLTYKHGLEVVKELQGVVDKKVCIESSQVLTDEEKETLMNKALEGRNVSSAFQCEWNSDEL